MGRAGRITLAIQLAAGASLGLLAMASCGARTGLLPEESGDAGLDGSSLDGSMDAPEESLPLIDTSVPNIAVINPCPDAAATLIYVLGESNALYSFDPSTGAFARIGQIDCPDSDGAKPFSMAVDREGVAYVIFADMGSGEATHLYRVSTTTAQCTETRYRPARYGRVTFGMGFVADVADGGETLYVSEDRYSGDDTLASIDTRTFALSEIGPYRPIVQQAELTGTGSGRLYAFQPGMPAMGIQPFLFQIDTSTAQVVAADPLPGINGGSGWAFGFWGGAFYTFTAPGGRTVVNKFDPVSKVITQVADAPLGDLIVGAGVSTCAPLRASDL